jgi:hypothetical protein
MAFRYSSASTIGTTTATTTVSPHLDHGPQTQRSTAGEGQSRRRRPQLVIARTPLMYRLSRSKGALRRRRRRLCLRINPGVSIVRDEHHQRQQHRRGARLGVELRRQGVTHTLQPRGHHQLLRTPAAACASAEDLWARPHPHTFRPRCRHDCPSAPALLFHSRALLRSLVHAVLHEGRGAPPPHTRCASAAPWSRVSFAHAFEGPGWSSAARLCLSYQATAKRPHGGTGFGRPSCFWSLATTQQQQHPTMP